MMRNRSKTMRKHRFGILICVLLLLTGCATEQEAHRIEPQETEACILCSAETEHEIQNYLGQDNIGIVNLNTFDVLPIETNCYDENGEMIQDIDNGCSFGLVSVGGISASVMCDPARGYAHIDLPRTDSNLNLNSLGHFLCQECFEKFQYFIHRESEVHEIAVLNFKTSELRPLENSCPWFASDNYLIDCDFEQDGKMDLRITYRPLR